MDVVNHDEDAIINQAAAMEMANAIAGTSVAQLDIPADEPEIVADDKADGEPASPTIDERIAAIVEENRQLRKGLESMNGTYGSELQALRSKVGSMPDSNNNDLSFALAGLSIDNPAFEDLRENYPELGGLIIDGIKTALTANPDPLQQDAVAEVQEDVGAWWDVEINNRIEQITQDQNQLALDIAIDKFNEEHPDKKDLEFEVQELARGATKIKWKNQAFGDWVESQPEDSRELLINGGNTPAEVRGISQLLAEFKKSKASEQNRPKRDQIKPDLSRSILPNGRIQQGSAKMTEDEIIAAAAIEEMKRNM